jgi:hypothetical protein
MQFLQPQSTRRPDGQRGSCRRAARERPVRAGDARTGRRQYRWHRLDDCGISITAERTADVDAKRQAPMPGGSAIGLILLKHRATRERNVS